MAATMIVLFNLKDGQSARDYERWARETDVPTGKGLSSVEDFRVYRVSDLLGSEARPPYGYVEVVDIRDLKRLGEEVGAEEVRVIAREFEEFAQDSIFFLTQRFA
jgi:hypothetical protein